MTDRGFIKTLWDMANTLKAMLLPQYSYSEETDSNDGSVYSSSCEDTQDDDNAWDGINEDLTKLGSYAFYEYCSEICTDALDSEEPDSVAVNPNMLFINLDSVVTLDSVLAIEGLLDLDEKVSLIYLLLNNAAHASNEIKVLLLKPQLHKPIYQWAKDNEETGISWKKAFVEALAIIQDFRILKTKFGYEKKVISNFYFPLNKYLAINVSKTRKMLYLVFDNLPSVTVRKVLLRIQKQLNAERKIFRIPDENGKFYFEMCLLDLERLDFITLDDVQNLANTFKAMEMFEIKDDLMHLIKDKVKENTLNVRQNFEKEKKLFIDVESMKETNSKLEQDNRNETSLSESHQSLPSNMSSVNSTSNYYNMNVSTPGIALIISNQYFYRDVDRENQNLLPSLDYQLQNREGTEADENALINTFTQLNFEKDSIILKQNRTHTQMLQDIQEAAGKVTEQHSTLFVAILTHGEEEIVYGVNSCKIDIKDIQKLMGTTNVSNLEGKPKILILQCCQGNKCQTITGDDDYELDAPESIRKENPEPVSKGSLPKSVDHFTFLATVPGYGAIRHKVTGTWFIQTFCKVMRTNSDSQHFSEICTETVSQVSGKIWSKNGQMRCMVPLMWSTLRKMLYLPPKLKKSLNDQQSDLSMTE